MSAVFTATYADSYDLLYQDKDYAAECDVIERIFQTHGENPIQSILDLGCGTGSHALNLAKRGYKVVGVDRSEDMLAHARRKAAELIDPGEIVFQEGDICRLDLQQRFDAVLIMFAALGYQLENAQVLSALKTAHNHLHPGGLLLFDVWYGPAVLHQRPVPRVKIIPTSEGRILRVASGELDTRHHVCNVHFQLWHMNKTRLIANVEEEHQMRYYFPLELELFLEQAGLTLVRLGAFPEYDSAPSEETWNVLGVARRPMCA